MPELPELKDDLDDLYIACIGKHSLSLALLLYRLHPHKACIRMMT